MEEENRLNARLMISSGGKKMKVLRAGEGKTVSTQGNKEST